MRRHACTITLACIASIASFMSLHPIRSPHRLSPAQTLADSLGAESSVCRGPPPRRRGAGRGTTRHVTAARARVACARVGVGLKTRVGKERKARNVDTLVFRAGEVIIREYALCSRSLGAALPLRVAAPWRCPCALSVSSFMAASGFCVWPEGRVWERMNGARVCLSLQQVPSAKPPGLTRA